MEKIERIEEITTNGERNIIMYANSKQLSIVGSNVFSLLIGFGSLDSVKDYFYDKRIDDIKYFINKNKIIFSEI